MWVINGIDPVTWSIPFWSDPSGPWTHICCAMQLTAYQQRTVEERIGAKMEAGQWKLSVTQLARIGHRVKHTGCAEDHFVWSRRRRHLLTPAAREKRHDRDSFLAELYLQGVGESEAENEAIWHQFCNAMLWHLINRETPIDFYFAKLHPSPLRRDWHQKKWISKCRHAQGISDRARKMFSIPGTFAWDGAACLRGVELELTRTWWKLARRVE